MDKPADPATPFREVYQHFLAVLKKHGRKESTRAKYLYDYQRFEGWLRQTGRPVTHRPRHSLDRALARVHRSAAAEEAEGSLSRRQGESPDVFDVFVVLPVPPSVTGNPEPGSCPCTHLTGAVATFRGVSPEGMNVIASGS